MSGICALLGSTVIFLAEGDMTLSWEHSVEHIRWEEDWRVEGDALVLTEARVRGAGAGMEAPAGAVLRDGVWHYRPVLGPLHEVRLANSPYGGGYDICTSAGCRLLPHDAGRSVTILRVCPAH